MIAAVLSKKKKVAFDSRDTDAHSFREWLKTQLPSPMFNYWYNVSESIKNVLLLVRSFREANIDLFIVALELIIPLFFVLGHIHYARWLSVFLEDLKLLHSKMPALYKEFKDGHFVVSTRGNTFSKIAMDQAQEHNNKKIKSSGSGYIDLVNTEDKRFLQKIELCWPEIHQYLVEVEGHPEAQGHKEITQNYLSQDSAKIVPRYTINL